MVKMALQWKRKRGRPKRRLSDKTREAVWASPGDAMDCGK